MTTNDHAPHTLFDAALAQTQKEIEPFLEKALADLQGPKILIQAMKDAVLGGGKRLRPFLHLEAVTLLGGKRQKALPIAAALELIHGYSLVHDDMPCMDNADLRRGKPTIHRTYGDAVALLAGNALFTLAFEVLHRASFSCRKKRLITTAFSTASGASGMMGGQFYDLFGNTSEETLEAQIYSTQQLKTGAIFETCIESALIFCEVPAPHPLMTYAHHLGLAFQIYDDLQDLLLDATETGKTTGLDVDKPTFVSVLGPKQAQEKAVTLLKEAVQSLTPFKEKAFTLLSAALVLKTKIEKIC